MTALQMEKRFHNLTADQLQVLDRVLTEEIPIHGRGNFPTLQVRAKDIIRLVKEQLVEKDIQVKDIRLNGVMASHVLVKDNGLGTRDLDIIFRVELARQEDFQVIKEVVLGSLRELLPCGVNRRKITGLTMKEAYVQKMVKVFNEHDRWSLISLSNDRAKTLALHFISALRRQFQFSVDSFQIILDRMLEVYWERERGPGPGRLHQEEKKEQENPMGHDLEEGEENGAAVTSTGRRTHEDEAPEVGKDHPGAEDEDGGREEEEPATLEPTPPLDDEDGMEDVRSEEVGISEARGEEQGAFCMDRSSAQSPRALVPDVRRPPACAASASQVTAVHTETPADRDGGDGGEAPEKTRPESQLELSSPPPPKKTCSPSQAAAPGFFSPPTLQRKLSRKVLYPPAPERRSLLTDLSNLTAQMVPPIGMHQPLQPPPLLDHQLHTPGPFQDFPVEPPEGSSSGPASEETFRPKQEEKPPDPKTPTRRPPAEEPGPSGCGLQGAETSITVEAECMYGDFERAMDHLRNRLIATHRPEEIRGGGLLRYGDLLVRNFRPASEPEIRSLERYMCSRFFIDFPDVGEQRRCIEAHLQRHLAGGEERGRYAFLMTLRRVVDTSTVCLMGHERRQTLDMITVVALKVLGEQNAIPNAARVTCFYQPALPYAAVFPPQAPPPLLYHPQPLHLHLHTCPV